MLHLVDEINGRDSFMSKNLSLHHAKKAKKDEFYTQLTDIEKELNYYEKHFKDKIIYCNCDDPYESNFFKFFAANFKYLGLKKLIATSYINSPITGTQLSLFEIAGLKNKDKKEPYKVEINTVEDFNNDTAINILDVEWLLKNDKNVATPLKADGDFRSEECIKILQEADIIVTNPPFSLFREYISQLIEYNKKFLIIGNVNAISYKEIFNLIKENKTWLGASGFVRWFIVNYDEKFKKVFKQNNRGETIINAGVCSWYTNLYHEKRNEELILYKKYSPKEYPKYDNYDAINVNKTMDIPIDYDGVMGVPISFLDKYCPDQFEIIGKMTTTGTDEFNYGYPYINRKKIYARILIKKVKDYENRT